MALKALCIELRPNLSSGHVMLQFEQELRDRRKTRLVIKEHDVYIITEDTKEGETMLVMRNDCFGMDIGQISVFVVSGYHISFRFNYTKIDFEALQSQSASPTALHPLPLLLTFVEHAEHLALHCTNCQYELVPRCSYKRLREFPSGLFDPSEFFCHSHVDAGSKQATLVPGPCDLYYGLNHIVLNMTVLQTHIINSSDHLYCKRCMCLVGVSILAGHAAKLWADALRWLPVKSSLVTLPRQLFQHSTVTQLMQRLLNNLWPEFSPVTNRALLMTSMPDRQQHIMLIQVLDPQLIVLTRTADAAELTYYRACKLYFRVFGTCQHKPLLLKQWQHQMQLPKLTISPNLFLEIQSRLIRNAQLVPYSWRYNTTEEKLQLTYFFYENEEQELLLQQKKQQQHKQKKPQPQQNILNTMNTVKKKQREQEENYETDAGLDGSLNEDENESDDEHSDTDSETKSSTLLQKKSAPIMDYEKNLVKRWPQQKQSNPVLDPNC